MLECVKFAQEYCLLISLIFVLFSLKNDITAFLEGAFERCFQFLSILWVIQNEFKIQEWGHVALVFDKLYIEYVQYQNP